MVWGFQGVGGSGNAKAISNPHRQAENARIHILSRSHDIDAPALPTVAEAVFASGNGNEDRVKAAQDARTGLYRLRLQPSRRRAGSDEAP